MGKSSAGSVATRVAATERLKSLRLFKPVTVCMSMKKLALIPVALALLGGTSVVGAANQDAKAAKNRSTQTASSQTGCCGGCCKKGIR